MLHIGVGHWQHMLCKLGLLIMKIRQDLPLCTLRLQKSMPGYTLQTCCNSPWQSSFQ